MNGNKVELDLNELEGVAGGDGGTFNSQVKWECNICHETVFTNGLTPAKKGCINNGSHAWAMKVQ